MRWCVMPCQKRDAIWLYTMNFIIVQCLGLSIAVCFGDDVMCKQNMYEKHTRKMFGKHVTTCDSACKVSFDLQENFIKKVVVEILAFSFEIVICCYQRTKPSESNLGAMCVVPFSLLPMSCEREPCFRAETPGHNSRGVEHHHPRFN